jgi:protein TonB
MTDAASPLNGDNGPNGDSTREVPANPDLAEPVLAVGPTYPIVDAQSCVDGTVRLRATIDRYGVVRSLEPVSGPTTLFGAAMSAVRNWRFRPAVRQGKAVEADRDVQVVFRNMLTDAQ